MHHLNHEFFSTISSMNSFSRSSRLNPHCPGGAGLWSGGGTKKHGVWSTVLPTPSLTRVWKIFFQTGGIALETTDVKLCHTPEWGPHFIFEVNVHWCFNSKKKCGRWKILWGKIVGYFSRLCSAFTAATHFKHCPSFIAAHTLHCHCFSFSLVSL